MQEIKLNDLPLVTGDPGELLDLDICDTCEFAVTQATRIAAVIKQIQLYSVTRYIAPGRQIIVSHSTRHRNGYQVTFYFQSKTGEMVPTSHVDCDTAAGAADEIPYNFNAMDALKDVD